MAAISIDHVTKVYPNGTLAVEDLCLEVGDGEFAVLVGPSGCGKTTALRMVAGLEDISEGAIRVGDRIVNDVSPRNRDIAMVFQNYALYPHMTVAENIGFSLKLRGVPKAEIRSKVEQAARVLGLSDHLRRKPSQLSGGQRQRVAMGRAIVREPEAFLMDEPLSNLDAKLRVQMRAEILRIQRRLDVATLYVTHDQTEAMTMGDRVAVLRSGRLQQYDAPQTLYDDPANVFVAAFIGSPAMNVYEAELSGDGSGIVLGPHHVALPPSFHHQPALAPYRGRAVTVGIRPENIHYAGTVPAAPPERRIQGHVELVEALGSEKLVHFRLDARRVSIEEPLNDPAEDPSILLEGEVGQAASSECVARTDASSPIRAGDLAAFVIDVEHLHFFDPDAGTAIV